MSDTEYRIGTASWTETTLIESGAFYPPEVRSAEARLRYYAERFDTVEVDSSYYALPSERNSELWVERTPPGFLFHVKAFSLLTGHGADTARLPRVLLDRLPEEERRKRRLRRVPSEVLDLAFGMFVSALEPLRRADKLGMLLFQFPPWFKATRGNARRIESCRDRLPEHRLAVEFRHGSWLAEERRERTLDFLRDLGLVYVIVDEPQLADTVPPIVASTAAEAYVRFHGHNRENWRRRGIPVAERYRYLYSDRELEDWAGRLRHLRGVGRVHALFNNCYADYGVRNAATLQSLL